ncbi:protein kinase [Microbulbifer sp. TYP-18]|uniref:protein kinase domain-containing protein n=1 Tax=Microbulbifer sp. TYP-18 TaxID=3230024 RepID=UPI0034C5B6B6
MTIAEPEQQQLDRYRIERKLGAGGMGLVYLARDTKLQRPVAIKKLRKDTTSATAARRIQSEAQLLARLNHPNIVQLYDVLEEGDGVALVMEYVEGCTLRQWMREHNPGLAQKLQLLIQICRGLAQAHSLGIVHRDLKADNVLITNFGVAKITDFGIAKSLQGDSDTLTREDQVAGTLEAMSPEQLQGQPLDARSDLFSLGALAYQLLCDAKPFARGEGGAVAQAHIMVNQPHTPPRVACPELPEALAALLDRLLSKLPQRRPQSATQVAEALALLQAQGPDAGGPEFSATVTRLLRKPSNRRRRLLIGLGITALLAGAGAWGWKQMNQLQPQYIAVLPVQIRGQVEGGDSAEALTTAMVRQALLSAATQLKTSALVSFTPKAGQDFDAQLRKLRDKGVTDALLAQLQCARLHCEIELQRINPTDSQIKQQTGFAFLADKRQEAQYRIANSATALFPSGYRLAPSEQMLMSDSDYRDYLNIIGRLESKELDETDLNTLIQLSDSYPKNRAIYRGIADTAARLFALTGNPGYLDTAARELDNAIAFGISATAMTELKLFLYTFGERQDQFELLIKKLEQENFPLAALMNNRARFFFRKGDYASGLDYAQQAVALHASADNFYLVSINQTASGDYTAARATLDTLTRSYPDHWSSFSLLGVIELENGNLDAAEAAITAIPQPLRSWRARKNLGVSYFLGGRYQEALEEFTNVLTQVPEDVSTRVHIAETRLMLGQKEAARKGFTEALALTEAAPGLRERRYRALAHLGHEAEAIALTHQLIQEAPGDKYIEYFSAQIYALCDQWPSAGYYIARLIERGMGAAWFQLPAFQPLCTRPQTAEKVSAALCR